ncbi:hypothetical protein D3C72_1163000 [compost metagenome]
MGRRQGADGAFQHGTAVEGDTGRLGDLRGAQHGARAAILGDLQGEDAGGAVGGQAEGVFDAFDGFVGHDRRRAALVQAHLACAVDARYGLFDQVDAVVAEDAAGAQGHGFVPGLVDVDAHAGAVAQGLLDGDDVGQVLVHLAGTDLQLEDAVAADFQHVLGFADVLGGVAAGQGPGHFQAVAHAATQQFADRQAEALALGVQQGAFQAGLGEGVALGGLVQAQHGGVDVGRVLADQQGSQVAVDVLLDAFRALVAVGQATDGGGFAQAFDAVGAAQADHHQGLVLHGVHGQLVRADGRQVDDDRLDAFDQDLAHFNTHQVRFHLVPIVAATNARVQYRVCLARYLQGIVLP